MSAPEPAVKQRAALYLRVSMARRAGHDVSIPDHKGRAIRMDRPDHPVVDYPEHRLLDPNRAGHARRASRPARGTVRTPPDPGERTHQTGGGSRTAP